MAGGAAAPPAEWFTVQRLDAATWALSEDGHPLRTHSYLCAGRERALLIDTGLGVGRIGDVVARLTGLPVTVIATHAHWDHLGGHGEFGDVGVHRAELDWITGRFPLSAERVRAELARGWDVPAGFDLASYGVFAGRPSRVLDGGERFDLGGRVLEAIHAPGHSPGHLCFWEAERGYLFAGDLVYRGTLFAHYPSTDPAAYLASLETVARLPVTRLLPGHHSLDVPVSLVAEVRDAFRSLDRTGDLRHGSGLHRFDGFAVNL